MSSKTKFPLNPDCSDVYINNGKETFIFFYYEEGGKRKPIKFKKGLNDKNLTEKKKQQLINILYAEVLTLLKTQVFNGKRFRQAEAKPVIPTFTSGAKSYVENRKQFLNDKTISNYQLGIKFFQDYLKLQDNSYILLSEINAELIEKYIVYLQAYVSPKYKNKLSKYTIKDYKERLGAVLKFWVLKKKVLESNPMDSVQLGYTLNNRTRTAASIFTVDELEKIIQYCKEHRSKPYLSFLMMIYYTHLRPIEICRLQLNDIDIDNGKIILPAAKGKTRIERLISLDKPILDHLRSTGIDFKNLELQDKFLFSCAGFCKIQYLGDTIYNHHRMGYYFNKMTSELGLPNRLNKYHLKHTANVHEVVYENMSFAEVQAKNGHVLSSQTEVYLRGIKEHYANNPTKKDRVLNFNI